MNTDNLCIHMDNMGPVKREEMPSYQKLQKLVAAYADAAAEQDLELCQKIQHRQDECRKDIETELKTARFEESLTSGDLTEVFKSFSTGERARVYKYAAEDFLKRIYSDSLRQTLIENQQSLPELEKFRTINHFDECGMSNKFWVTFNPVVASVDQLRSIMNETFQSWDIIETCRYVLECRTDTDIKSEMGGFHTHFLIKTCRDFYKSTIHQRLYQKWNRYCGNKKHIVISAYTSESYEKSKITYMLKHPKHVDDKFIYPGVKALTIIDNCK